MQNIEKGNPNELSNKNKVDLTIKYVAGNYQDSFNVHQTIGHVFDKAIKHFHIDEAAASKLGLFFNGTQQEKSKTIEQCALPDGAVLILSSIQSGDIEG